MLRICEKNSSVIKKFGILLRLSRCENFSRPSRNGPLSGKNSKSPGKFFFPSGFQTFRSYLVSHEPPHIQNNPSSDLNLRSMRSAPLIFLSVHVTGRGRAFDARQPRTKVDLEGQRPLEEKTPRKHLYLITYQNVRVPFADYFDQSRKDIFLFSYILYFVIRDP